MGWEDLELEDREESEGDERDGEEEKEEAPVKDGRSAKGLPQLQGSEEQLGLEMGTVRRSSVFASENPLVKSAQRTEGGDEDAQGSVRGVSDGPQHRSVEQGGSGKEKAGAALTAADVAIALRAGDDDEHIL